MGGTTSTLFAGRVTVCPECSRPQQSHFLHDQRVSENGGPSESIEVSESSMRALIFMHVTDAARVKSLIITLLPAGIVTAFVVFTCPRLAQQLLSLSCAAKLCPTRRQAVTMSRILDITTARKIFVPTRTSTEL